MAETPQKKKGSSSNHDFLGVNSLLNIRVSGIPSQKSLAALSRGTSGLFAPSFLVASIAELAIQHLKRYVFWTDEPRVFFQKW